MEETLAMNDSADKNRFFKTTGTATRPNWLFDIEHYSRSNGESLTELRDNLRLKKTLKRAVEKDFAPEYLIRSIRARIGA